MPLRRMVLACSLLLLPSIAWAMQTATWDFRGGKVPGNWNVGGFDAVTPEEGGLHIKSTRGGQMERTNDVLFPIDAVGLLIESPKETTGKLLWHGRTTPQGELVILPFDIAAGQSVIQLNVSDYTSWDPLSDRLGIALDGGNEIRLVQMDFYSWNLWEKLGEMWKSFWVMDIWEPYTINFIWGPVLTQTPIGTVNLFQVPPPPRGWSFGRVLLPTIGIAGLLLLLHWLLFDRRSRRTWWGAPWHLTFFLLVVATGWFVFDARMGWELLSYVRDDYQGFVLKSPPREFRSVGTIHDDLAAILPTLRKESRFVLHTPSPSPFPPIVRYVAYPSLPIHQEDVDPSVKNWLIIDRPDITVGSGGLLYEGRVLSPPGTVVHRMNDTSFLYRTH